MSKKKIIAAIMGTTTLITGNEVVNTAASVREAEETTEKENKKRKKDKSQIRRKRENSELTYDNIKKYKELINSLNKSTINNFNFVEKIYNYDDSVWKLSLILNKKIALMIIKIFFDSYKLNMDLKWSPHEETKRKDNFIKETKKLITDIKKHGLNLSAMDFDEGNIDAFSNQIWKNFLIFCDLFVNLGINQKIQIRSDITHGYWGNFNFKIVGEKNELEKEIFISPKQKLDYNTHYNGEIREYVEKIIYNNNKEIEINFQNNGNKILILSNIFTAKLITIIDYYKNNKNENLCSMIYFWIKNYIDDYLNEDITSSELNIICQKIIENQNYIICFFDKNNNDDKILIFLNKKQKSVVYLSLTEYNCAEYNNNFVEKIYNYDDSVWKLSLILSKKITLMIIKLFMENNKTNFIKETKKLIIDIKKHGLNLSAMDFDENAIDAFAYHIWKKIIDFYYLFVNLGINQQIKIRLDIKNNEWVNDHYKIIGNKIGWENNNDDFNKINYDKNKKIIKNTINDKKNTEHSVLEKWSNNKIKIKINKKTWSQISVFLFIIKDKNIFLQKLTELFNSFSSVGTYNLNEEDIKSFVYLIFKNFSQYYDIFLKLNNDESIRITSYSGYPEGYWTEEKFNDYNEIIDNNNNIIEWKIINNIQAKNNETETIWTGDKDEFKRKKRIDKDTKPITNIKNNIPIDLSKIILETNLYSLPNSKEETILQYLSFTNHLLDTNKIAININEKNKTIEIKPNINSNYYTGSVTVAFTLQSDDHVTRQNISQYDVSSDGNCLFWSVATAFLLPFRNNKKQFEERFIRLFGIENRQYLLHIQQLLNNFDLQNNNINQSWYRDPYAINLVTNVFRNVVTEYIWNNREMFEAEINYEGHNFEEYLSSMRRNGSWGGGIEIAAMSYILNTQIFVNNSGIRNENENLQNNVQIFHVHGNHYNFALSKEEINNIRPIQPGISKMDIDNIEPQPGTSKMDIDQEHIKLSETQNNENIYDVPNNTESLFLTIITSYLLPVRNNENEFLRRSIKLFGLSILRYQDVLKEIRYDLLNFDLNNTSAVNQSWYIKWNNLKLLTNFFRFQIVEFIITKLENINEKNASYFDINLLKSLLRDENELWKSNSNLTKEEKILKYFHNFLNSKTLLGETELWAISAILNIDIIINNNKKYCFKNNEKEEKNDISIKIYSDNKDPNNYKFVLENKELRKTKFAIPSTKLKIENIDKIIEKRIEKNLFLEDLNSVILNNNLGGIIYTNEKSFKKEILKKLLRLNPKLDLRELNFDKNENKLIISANIESEYYMGKKEIKYQKITSKKDNINLWNDLKNIDLGQLPDNNPETILQAIIKKNQNFDINQIKLIKIKTKNAAVIPTKNSSYDKKSFLLIKFSLLPTKDLKSLDIIISKTDLGQLPDNEPDTILKAIIAKNNLLNNIELCNALRVIITNNNSAVISVSSKKTNKYNNLVFVYFKLSEYTLKKISKKYTINRWWAKDYGFDLREKFNIKMEKQKKDDWCCIAVLQNIINNKLKQNNGILSDYWSQQFIYNNLIDKKYFVPGGGDGIYLYNIYKYVLDNYSIFRFYYHHLDANNFLFENILISKNQRMSWFEMLIWSSLAKETPVFLGNFFPTTTEKGLVINGHSIMIVSIKPDPYDISKTIYTIRDPEPILKKIWNPEKLQYDDYYQTEEELTGDEMYDLFFNKYFFGEMLIDSNSMSLSFLPSFIELFKDSLNNEDFKNILKPELSTLSLNWYQNYLSVNDVSDTISSIFLNDKYLKKLVLNESESSSDLSKSKEDFLYIKNCFKFKE